MNLQHKFWVLILILCLIILSSAAGLAVVSSENAWGGESSTMDYSVECGDFGGIPAYELIQNGKLSATIVPDLGANMISLKWLEKGIELLKRPDSPGDLRKSPVGYGNPVLLPPNRIRNGRFMFEGKVYTFPPSHGVAHSIKWQVASSSADVDGARLVLKMNASDYPEVLKAFKEPFTLELTFTVKDYCVTIDITAENLGNGNLPFGLGFHPFFNAPLAEEGNRNNCLIQMNAMENWQLINCFPTGKIVPVQGKYDLREGRSLGGLFLDDVFTNLTAEDGLYKAWFYDETAKAGIELSSGKEFPHWVIYTGELGKSDFICIEPYTWVNDAPNLKLPGDISGFRALKPGEVWKGNVVFRPVTEIPKTSLIST